MTAGLPADHLAHFGDGLGAKGQGRDASRAVGPEHFVDAEFLGNDQDGGVNLARRARDRRHDHGYVGHAGHNRRRTELHEHGRVRGLTARDEQPSAGDRGDLLADAKAGLGFEAPVTAGDELFVEAANVTDAVTNGPQQLGRDCLAGGGELLLAHVKLGRVDVTTVELFQRTRHSLVAVQADVLDQLAYFPAQPRVKDLVEARASRRPHAHLN